MKTLKLEVVTQEKLLLQAEVTSLTVETVLGEITILPEHQPLVSRLKEGVLKYIEGGKDEYVAIFGGFIEVSDHGSVSVLADAATRADAIDIAKVQAAKQEAEKAMEDRSSEQEFILAEAALRKAMLEIRAHERLKSSRTSSPTHSS